MSSVTVSSAFNATYENYRITITGGSSSIANEYYLTFGSTSTGYKHYQVISAFSNTLISAGNSSGTNIQNFRGDPNGQNAIFDVLSPNLAKITFAAGSSADAGQVNQFWGILNNTTQYTAFTLTTGSGTLTGGTIRVYGYQNS